jgi:hypothetical protein
MVEPSRQGLVQKFGVPWALGCSGMHFTNLKYSVGETLLLKSFLVALQICGTKFKPKDLVPIFGTDGFQPAKYAVVATSDCVRDPANPCSMFQYAALKQTYAPPLGKRFTLVLLRVPRMSPISHTQFPIEMGGSLLLPINRNT